MEKGDKLMHFQPSISTNQVGMRAHNPSSSIVHKNVLVSIPKTCFLSFTNGSAPFLFTNRINENSPECSSFDTFSKLIQERRLAYLVLNKETGKLEKILVTEEVLSKRQAALMENDKANPLISDCVLTDKTEDDFLLHLTALKSLQQTDQENLPQEMINSVAFRIFGMEDNSPIPIGVLEGPQLAECISVLGPLRDTLKEKSTQTLPLVSASTPPPRSHATSRKPPKQTDGGCAIQ